MYGDEVISMTDVFLDGEVIGKIEEPKDLREKLIEMRRNGQLDSEVNVRFDEDKDEIRVSSDSGRVRRPLVIVEEGEPKLTEEHEEKIEEGGELDIEDLEEKGIIEYLDADEEENAFVAMRREEVTEDHDYMELDPAIMHGLSASLVVYPENNRGDRVNYGAKMSGQGLGMYTTNFHTRYDTNASVFVYPQTPIVETESTENTIGKHPIGQNLVIAISSFEGYNMEDAVIFNKASIDRGVGRSFYFRTYTTESRRYWGGQRDEIGIPDKDVRRYRSEEEYAHLPEDGIVNPETSVDDGDVLVAKTSPPKFLGSGEEVKMGLATKRETSKTVRHGEEGVVDKVMISETSEGNKLIKVKLREQRTPELGDKFATRHGQKGVIGLIVPEEDMPFSSDGVTPDIILSTHAIPSRMTVSQLIEIIGGKTAAMRGEKVNGTAFKGEKEEKLRKELENHGFRYDGKERLYNGVTGEPMDAQILMGPGYYLKLKHMVADKIHARSRGPVTLLTKQPTAGRAREGGLRLGEMEKDCFVSHGSSLLLKERFGADKTKSLICQNCGEIATRDEREGKTYCARCGEEEDIEEIQLPQAFLLMLNELKSLMVSTKINLAED